MVENPDIKTLYKTRVDRLLQRVNDMKTKVVENTQTKRIMSRIEKIKAHLDPGQLLNNKNVYIESKKTIPIVDSCQVLVVGGGPAGLSAAIGASRAGCDVILVERYGCFGGVITTVGMETLGWYRYQGTEDTEGIGREMERIAERMGGTTKWPYNDSQCLDAERFKLVADRLVMEHGIRPRLHSYAVDVMMTEDIINGVILESKSGRQAIRADRVVDATGDADITYLAGGAFTTEPLVDRMSVTPVFNCCGVDRDRFLYYTEKNTKKYRDWSSGWEQITTGKEEDLKTPYLDQEFRQAEADGIIPKSNDDLGKTETICGTWSALSDQGEATNLNLVHLSGYDCTNVDDLTKAEMVGRQQTEYAIQALRDKVPGFEEAKLRNFGMTMGTRDSRKIVGEYQLTGKDVLNQARFPDSVGVFPEFLDGYNILVIPTSGRYFQVPLGCLLPKKINNLLVAGRCVAGDKVSHTAMRNMMACTVTGQGAGVAAAISVKHGINVKRLPIKLVQQELVRQGVRIN